jgi:subfamily B ATP-binding cassette protein HlyB/CyaB
LRAGEADTVLYDTAEALFLLSSFCAAHRRPFDAQLVLQQFPPPFSADQFRRAADALGLAPSRRVFAARDLVRERLPLMVQWTDGWAMVLAADETRVLVAVRGAERPQVLPRAEFLQRAGRDLLVVVPHAPRVDDPDRVTASGERFGLRWFVPEILKHRPVWRDVLLASLVLQVLALAMPLFTQVVIDKVVVHRTESTLIALGVGMLIFIVFTGALGWVRQYLILHTGNRIDAVLGANTFDHLFKLPPLYFQHRPTGVIAARLQGIETIREFLASAAVTLALDLPFMAIFLAMMFWYSVTLTLIVLAVLAVIVALSFAAAPLFRRRLNEQFLRGAANQAFLTEYIAGIETVKSLQFEPQLGSRYRELLAALLKSTFATRQLANTYNSWANSLEQLMTLLILAIGAWIVMTTTTLTIGMLVAFQMFAGRISQPMLRLVGLWQQWQQTRIAIARLGDILNAPAEPYSLAPQRTVSAGSGHIQVEGLGFRYAPELPAVYEQLSLEILPGELVALMGPSGSGKSTLAKLLQGFYLPSQGRIRIDGVDTTYLSANELRARFGVVPQETVLFSGTVLDNLKLANPFATFEQVTAACRMAEIHSVIEELPQGYQTALGERGTGLSGGQRQRIAIARALLKGPKVLIFDEATSGLDAPTAELFARTVNSLKGRVSILFIAHALPKNLQADRIERLGEKLSVVAADRQEPGA